MCNNNHQKDLEKLTIKKGNLLEIRTVAISEPSEAINRTPRNGSLNNKCIVYTANALRQIRLLQHDHRFKILPFGAIDNIRKFKLNYKPIKNNKYHQGHHQDGSDHRNIVKINKVGYKLDSRIIFATSNIQSIRLKELQVN